MWGDSYIFITCGEGETTIVFEMRESPAKCGKPGRSEHNDRKSAIT